MGKVTFTVNSTIPRTETGKSLTILVGDRQVEFVCVMSESWAWFYHRASGYSVRHLNHRSISDRPSIGSVRAGAQRRMNALIESMGVDEVLRRIDGAAVINQVSELA